MIEKKVEHKQATNSENTFNKVDWKLDAQMNKFMKAWLVEKVLNNKIVKDTLWSKVINDLDAKLKPYLKNFFTVIWRLAVVGWILWIVSSLSALWLFFRRNFGTIYLLYVLISLVFSLLALVTWYWMIKFKKRVVLVTLVELLLSVISFLMAIISSGNFWSAILNLLLSVLLTIIVLKNKDMFKN